MPRERYYKTTINCNYCKKSFAPRSKTHKFCSNRCRVYFYRHKRKEHNIVLDLESQGYVIPRILLSDRLQIKALVCPICNKETHISINGGNNNVRCSNCNHNLCQIKGRAV